jgi:hypothetical protein
MNLVVNKNGALQFMSLKSNEMVNNSNQYEQYNNQYNQNQYEQYNNQYNQNQYNQNQYIPQKNNLEPIEPLLKHSYIYNKYFKDYVDPNIEKSGPRLPKTKEEYFKMLMEDKINALNQKKRIEEIKSKKIMFEGNPRNIVASKNNLRSMNFG